MSHEEHKRLSADEPVRCAVLTISDTRTEETDRSGALITGALADAGHQVAVYRILRDDAELIAESVDQLAGTVEALLLTGGTGISQRDNTYPVLAARYEKDLPGFGELFRMLSYHEIGASAMLSRASAGVYRGSIIFSLPGSATAVRLALQKLVLPELAHIVWELHR